MSHELVFSIFPYDPDPLVTSGGDIQFSIDMDDLAQHLREKWPEGEVIVFTKDGETGIRFYISTEKEGLWDIAGFIANNSEFYVRGWPKRMAKEIIIWYRQYISMNYPLFLYLPDEDYMIDLIPNTSFDDIENMYPYLVSDD